MIFGGEITIREALIICARRLHDAGVKNSNRNAEILLSNVLGLNRSQIFLNGSKKLLMNERNKLEKFVWRRILGEPVQYIVGETEFFGLKFRVDNRVLIPRPETEILVEWALKILDNIDNPRVLDLGTGSGSIAVSIAVNKKCRITAVDNVLSALQIAAENSRINNVRDKIQFVVGDIFYDDLLESVGNDYDLVACNPPYISWDEMDELDTEVSQYEPSHALTDGKDGLEYYRRLNTIIPRLCKEGGWALIEIADMRAQEALKIMSHSLQEIELRNDLVGRPRVIGGRCSSK